MGDPSDRQEPAAAPNVALLELLRLSSAALPTGTFAYSQGLETMVNRNRIATESDAVGYLVSLLAVSLGELDLPRIVRLHRAWRVPRHEDVKLESSWLFAARESREAQVQERQTASALLRICQQVLELDGWHDCQPRTYAEVFSFAAVSAGIDERACALGYCYAWAESHTNALARLLSLGPMATQRILTRMLAAIPAHVERAVTGSETAIRGATPGLAIAMAMHETESFRVFRS